MILTPYMKEFDTWSKPRPGKHSTARKNKAKAKYIKNKERK